MIRILNGIYHTTNQPSNQFNHNLFLKIKPKPRPNVQKNSYCCAKILNIPLKPISKSTQSLSPPESSHWDKLSNYSIHVHVLTWEQKWWWRHEYIHTYIYNDAVSPESLQLLVNVYNMNTLLPFSLSIFIYIDSFRLSSLACLCNCYICLLIGSSIALGHAFFNCRCLQLSMVNVHVPRHHKFDGQNPPKANCNQ